ncbi:putative multi-domain containing protein [Aduncisulcus paluster]|uniref:Multi-domain containing protein n=1 Tax=Aduncisulcus paluster TaxID=2918883 RepID=A0ABQ5JSY5_9EUKA|nr:putative multi-domain containing protein [Aduncisulcus paluster]
MVSLDMLIPIILNASGGLNFGYNLTNATDVISVLDDQYGWGISSLEQEIITSGLILGCCISSFTAGWLADRFGRKWIIIASAILSTFGCLISMASWEVVSMTIFRFVIGLGVGAMSAVVPMWTGEMVNSNIRGFMTGFFQIMVTVGIMIAYLVGYAIKKTYNWRASYGCGGLFAFVSVVCVFWIRESTTWEKKVGKTQTSPSLLEEEDKEEEPKEIVGDEKVEEQPPANVSWSELAKNYPICLTIAIVMPLGQQLCGINALILYSTSIFESCGYSTDTASLMGVFGVGIVNFVCTVIGVPLSDKLGRRPLMLVGYTLVGIGNLIMFVSFSWLLDDPTTLAAVAIPGIVIFLFGFEIGPGPLYYIVMSELFPTEIKAKCFTLCNPILWFCNLLISMFFISVSDAIGTNICFLIFAIVSIAMFIILFSTLPETKGKDLSEIHKMMKKSHPDSFSKDPELLEGF